PQLRRPEGTTRLIGGGSGAPGEPGEQGSLLRSAPPAGNGQLAPSGWAHAPPLDGPQRRLTRPQTHRQCRGKYKPKRVVIVLGCPTEQVEGDRVADRPFGQKGECGLE